MISSKQKVEQTFGQKLANVKDNDPFKASRITSINNEKSDEVDAWESFKENEKKKKKKKKKKKEKELQTLMKKLKMLIKNKKITTMIEFDCHEWYCHDCHQ